MSKRTKVSKCFLMAGVFIGLVFLLQTNMLSAEGRTKPKNLLKNGSFEKAGINGQPVGWKKNLPDKKYEKKATLSIASGGKSGGHELQLCKSEPLKWVGAFQYVNMKLVQGEKYTYSVWLKADKPMRVRLAIYALGKRPDDYPKTKLLYQVVNDSITVGSEWKKYNLTMTIDDKAPYTRLRVHVQLHTSDVTLSVDDANLIKEGSALVYKTAEPCIVGCVKATKTSVVDG